MNSDWTEFLNFKMIIFDLHYLCWRSHFANPGLEHEGELTGAIHGVLQQIFVLTRKFHDNHIIFACDSPYNLRKQIYPLYKRKEEEKSEADEWLFNQGLSQIQKIKKDVLPWLGFKNIWEYEGYEADDVIAAYLINSEINFKPLVITNDDDLLQLLDYCNLYSPVKKRIITKKEFQRQNGIPPQHWIRVKQLAGCSSDKVPGVPGIGNKRALAFLKHELKIDSKAHKNITQARKERKILPRNLKLVKLPLENCPIFMDKQDNCVRFAFRDICKKYGLKKLWEMYHDNWERVFCK